MVKVIEGQRINFNLIGSKCRLCYVGEPSLGIVLAINNAVANRKEIEVVTFERPRDLDPFITHHQLAKNPVRSLYDMSSSYAKDFGTNDVLILDFRSEFVDVEVVRGRVVSWVDPIGQETKLVNGMLNLYRNIKYLNIVESNENIRCLPNQLLVRLPLTDFPDYWTQMCNLLFEFSKNSDLVFFFPLHPHELWFDIRCDIRPLMGRLKEVRMVDVLRLVEELRLFSLSRIKYGVMRRHSFFELHCGASVVNVKRTQESNLLAIIDRDKQRWLEQQTKNREIMPLNEVKLIITSKRGKSNRKHRKNNNQGKAGNRAVDKLQEYYFRSLGSLPP